MITTTRNNNNNNTSGFSARFALRCELLEESCGCQCKLQLLLLLLYLCSLVFFHCCLLSCSVCVCVQLKLWSIQCSFISLFFTPPTTTTTRRKKNPTTSKTHTHLNLIGGKRSFASVPFLCCCCCFG